LARTNTISADFKVSAGDGADSISASFPSTSFTSGDATLINGTCGNVAAQTWTVANFLGASVTAGGLFFENRDAAIAITLTLEVGGSAVSTLVIPAGGVYVSRHTNAVDVIKVQAASATADYTLAFGE
jgi:hypothetical protein